MVRDLILYYLIIKLKKNIADIYKYMNFIQYCLQFGDRWIEMDRVGNTYFFGYIICFWKISWL